MNKEINRILKEKIKNIILSKDRYTLEETLLIIWFVKQDKPNYLDTILNQTKKIVNYINENIKESE